MWTDIIGGVGGGVTGFLSKLATNWALNSFLSSTSEALSQFINYFGGILNNLFVIIADINNEWAGDIAKYTTALACLFIILLAVKQYFTVYVLETEGDPDSDPMDILLRASEAMAFACSGTAIFDVMMDFSKALVSEFLFSSAPENADLVNILVGLHKSVTTAPGLLVLVIIVIGLILFSISAGIRGAELILMKALFPIFACDKITTNRERWNSFFTTYIITWVSYGLQLFSFKMFLYGVASMAADNGISNFTNMTWICIGWMVLMIRAPKWLQQFCYSSGVANGATGTTRSAAYMIPGVSRMFH